MKLNSIRRPFCHLICHSLKACAYPLLTLFFYDSIISSVSLWIIITSTTVYFWDLSCTCLCNLIFLFLLFFLFVNRASDSESSDEDVNTPGPSQTRDRRQSILPPAPLISCPDAFRRDVCSTPTPSHPGLSPVYDRKCLTAFMTIISVFYSSLNFVYGAL